MKQLAVLALAIAFALDAHAGSKQEEWIISRWKTQTAESADLLTKGEYERSLRIANRLIDEMMEKLGPGEGSAELFGTVIAQKALASAGLGNKDDALWYWQAGTALFPQLAEKDLSPFGAIAEVLKHPPEPLGNLPPGEVTAPRLLKKVDPVYPSGALDFGVAGNLVLRVRITKTGTVADPQIVKALSAATLSFAALEAVKQWRFEPGRVGGQPVDILFNLTVAYKK